MDTRRKDEINEARIMLLKDVNRWIKEFSDDEPRGTLSVGIGSNAIRNFDKLMRELLMYFVSACDIDYKAALPMNLKNKTINELTLGQVIRSFIDNNATITKYIKTNYQEKILLNTRFILDDETKDKLLRINSIRNNILHPEHYGKNALEKIEKDIIYLLSLLKDVMTGPLFTLIYVDKDSEVISETEDIKYGDLRREDFINPKKRKALKKWFKETYGDQDFNVFAEKGDKVICANKNVSYSEDQEKAEKYLKIGDVYTIEWTYPTSWITYIELQEFPGVLFNSIHFNNLA